MVKKEQRCSNYSMEFLRDCCSEQLRVNDRESCSNTIEVNAHFSHTASQGTTTGFQTKYALLTWIETKISAFPPESVWQCPMLDQQYASMPDTLYDR